MIGAWGRGRGTIRRGWTGVAVVAGATRGWGRNGRFRRGSGDDSGRCDDGSGARWRGLGGGFGLLALKDGFERVAGFGDLGEVEPWLALDGGLARRTALAAVFEVLPDPFGLVGFDGAGVRLPSYADCFQRIQNRPALDFQFSCQIVDSNFAHPSLFASLRP